ncbi:MAG: hypothetical protein PHW76_06550 [Alphaproteobacteria bacterium]|nr:hypothetical protein [Alphaproteobacteria bacterium]
MVAHNGKVLEVTNEEFASAFGIVMCHLRAREKSRPPKHSIFSAGIWNAAERVVSKPGRWTLSKLAEEKNSSLSPTSKLWAIKLFEKDIAWQEKAGFHSEVHNSLNLKKFSLIWIEKMADIFHRLDCPTIASHYQEEIPSPERKLQVNLNRKGKDFL